MSFQAESNKSVFDRLPDSVLRKLLFRFPSKSLCRLTSVSKRFKSIISHPKFLPSYISNVSLPFSWLILDRRPQLVPESAHPIQLEPLDPPNISTCSIIPKKLTSTDPAIVLNRSILQTSNGLILLALLSHHPRTPVRDLLFVVNPIRSEWVELPQPKNFTVNRSFVGFTARESCMVSKFIAVEYRPMIKSTTLLCFVSDTGEWVEKSANYIPGSHRWRNDGSFDFKGKLFWFDLDHGLITWDFKDNDYFKCVGSNEMAVCRFIPLPVYSGYQRWVGGGGGSIQSMEVVWARSFILKLWTLVGSEWHLRYRVSGENVNRCLPSPTLMPYFVDPFDADVAYFRTGNFILSFNLHTQNGTLDAFTPPQYVLPFVLPNWPLPIPKHLCNFRGLLDTPDQDPHDPPSVDVVISGISGLFSGDGAGLLGPPPGFEGPPVAGHGVPREVITLSCTYQEGDCLYRGHATTFEELDEVPRVGITLHAAYGDNSILLPDPGIIPVISDDDVEILQSIGPAFSGCSVCRDFGMVKKRALRKVQKHARYISFLTPDEYWPFCIYAFVKYKMDELLAYLKTNDQYNLVYGPNGAWGLYADDILALCDTYDPLKSRQCKVTLLIYPHGVYWGLRDFLLPLNQDGDGAPEDEHRVTTNKRDLASLNRPFRDVIYFKL